MILSLVFLENSAFFLLICLCYHTELILLENDCDNFLVIGIFDKFPLFKLLPFCIICKYLFFRFIIYIGCVLFNKRIEILLLFAGSGLGPTLRNVFSHIVATYRFLGVMQVKGILP